MSGLKHLSLLCALLKVHVSQGVICNINGLKDCLTSIRYTQIFLESPVTNAMTVKALPQSTFVLLKHRDDNRAKVHPKMFHDLDTRTVRDSESKCLASAIDNWSTITGHTLRSSKSLTAVIGTSPLEAQVSMLALSCEDNFPLDNWLTFDGRTLGSSKSHATVMGTSPWIVQVSLASDSDNLTPLDNCPQSTSLSEPELASRDCLLRLPVARSHHLKLYHGIRQHETIIFILDIKDLGQPSHSLEHRRAMLQEHILEDIQSLLTFALTMSTNIRMCTRQHTLGHEMKLCVKKM